MNLQRSSSLHRVAGVIALAAISSLAFSQALITGLDTSNGNGDGLPENSGADYVGTRGIVFQTGNTLNGLSVTGYEVTKLGFIDVANNPNLSTQGGGAGAGDGLMVDHTVSIWTASNPGDGQGTAAPLASVVVKADGSNSTYDAATMTRWVNLATPITLAINTYYTLAGTVVAGKDYTLQNEYFNQTAETTPGLVTANTMANRFTDHNANGGNFTSTGEPLNQWSWNQYNQGYFVANMYVQSAPEPSMILGMVVGLAGLMLLSKRAR